MPSPILRTCAKPKKRELCLTTTKIHYLPSLHYGFIPTHQLCVNNSLSWLIFLLLSITKRCFVSCPVLTY